MAQKLHRLSVSQRDTGTAPDTLITRYSAFRQFVTYLDDQGIELSVRTLVQSFQLWAKELESRRKRKKLTPHSEYGLVTRVGSMIAGILAVPKTEVMVGVRIKKPKTHSTRYRDKQNLEIAQRFVGDLNDVVTSLSDEALAAASDVEVKIEGATIHKFRRTASGATLWKGVSIAALNLRMAAEFSLFIAATGVNRSVATGLVLGDRTTFRTAGEHIEITGFKERSGSNVEILIQRRYRPHFERLQVFRRRFYEGIESDRLFVTVRPHGTALAHKVDTDPLVRILGQSQRIWVPPSLLRKTKGNKFIRLASVDAAAKALQNTAAVLDKNYRYAAHQGAVIEMTAYYRLLEDGVPIRRAVGPGACAGDAPEQITTAGESPPLADCRSPAGCLFCRFNRGIESLDYVWSLMSFTELKKVEYARYKHQTLSDDGPVGSTLRRLQVIFGKLAAVERMRPILAEAHDRIARGNHHPRWRYWIQWAEA